MSEQAQMETTPAQATGAGGDQIGRIAGEAQAGGEAQAASEALIADELLVEEISIDGMCGVY
jgi:mycofactocin precursor